MAADPLWTLLSPLSAPWVLVAAQQNAAPPPKPYAAYSVRSAVPLGTVLGDPDATGARKLSGPVLLHIEVNFFGSGSSAKARAMALMLRAPPVTDAAAALDLGVARIVAVTDATSFADEPQQEERAVLEARINATDAATVLGSNIEHVVIEPDAGAAPPFVTCGEVVSAGNATTPPPAP